jgi:hypothetical protein
MSKSRVVRSAAVRTCAALATALKGSTDAAGAVYALLAALAAHDQILSSTPFAIIHMLTASLGARGPAKASKKDKAGAKDERLDLTAAKVSALSAYLLDWLSTVHLTSGAVHAASVTMACLANTIARPAALRATASLLSQLAKSAPALVQAAHPADLLAIAQDIVRLLDAESVADLSRSDPALLDGVLLMLEASSAAAANPAGMPPAAVAAGHDLLARVRCALFISYPTSIVLWL